jgi:hypothetical protein
MRLIDADTIWYDQLLNTGNKEHPLEWAVSRSRIDNMPTIEVVRCKDCKHNSFCRFLGNTYCDLGIGLYQLDNFCSRGERREDETD